MPTTPASPPVEAHHALPAGLRLGEFEIRGVIGVGGFGIVYHAFDHALERDVAIKEYMPGALAARSATLHVSVLSQGHAETFALGLKSFVNEARLLARFDHPSLVKVHRFWEAHGTAYMAMPLYRGRTLKALRQARTDSPDEAWLRGLLGPLLGALDLLHAEGVYHRDIAPDNILVTDDGRPVLLDFGAARRVIGDRSQTLTAILKPSYAPIEQYAEAEGLRQGPWTDLYALGATLCYAITGSAPQPATARALGTDRHTLAALPRAGVTTEFLRVIDWMMAPRPEHRPQSVAALREVLEGHAAAPVAVVTTAASPAASAWERTAVQAAASVPTSRPSEVDAPTVIEARPGARRETPAARSARRAPLHWAVAAAALAVAGVAVAAWRLGTPARHEVPPTVATVAAPVTAAPSASGSAAPAIPPPTSQAAAVEFSSPAASASAEAPVVAPRREAATAAVRHPRPVAARQAPTEVPTVAAGAAPSAAEASNEAIAAQTPSSSPREQCEGRHLLALHRCLKRACEAPEWASHRDCRRVRQVEAAAAQRADH